MERQHNNARTQRSAAPPRANPTILPTLLLLPPSLTVEFDDGKLCVGDKEFVEDVPRMEDISESKGTDDDELWVADGEGSKEDPGGGEMDGVELGVGDEDGSFDESSKLSMRPVIQMICFLVWR